MRDQRQPPVLGRKKLSDLTKPGVAHFRDHLLDQGNSTLTVEKILIALKALLKTAEEYGYVGQNVALGATIAKNHRDRDPETSQGQLMVGRGIPTKAEVRLLIDTATEGKWRTFLIVLAFCRLRASEARGLMWTDDEGMPLVELENRTLTVQQRADRYTEMGVEEQGRSAYRPTVADGHQHAACVAPATPVE